jgi:hypothetical protein
VCDELPDMVLVKLRDNGATSICSIPGLPENVFPLLPITKDLNVQQGRKKFKFKLTQLPLVSTSAITVHKVQGQSLDSVVITKWRDPQMGNAQYPMSGYVALSRVRRLTGLFITQELTQEDCDFLVPPLSVIDELERIDQLQPIAIRTDAAILAARRVPAAALAQRNNKQRNQNDQTKENKSNQSVCVT